MIYRFGKLNGEEIKDGANQNYKSILFHNGLMFIMMYFICYNHSLFLYREIVMLMSIHWNMITIQQL